MFNVALLVTATLGLALVGLGLGVYLRNARSLLNKLFFAFAIAVAVWIIINYVAANPVFSLPVLLWSNRVVLIAGGFTLTVLLAFLLRLTSWKVNVNHIKYGLISSGLSWLLCLTPFVVHSVSIDNEQVVNKFGALAPVYFLTLFLTAIATGVLLLRAHFKLAGQLRVQVDIISRSVLIVVPVVVYGNAILPLQGHYDLVNYTPLSISLVVATMAYVIVKHKLFNVRTLIVRTIAYVVSLGVISILYAFGAHYVGLFLSDLHNTFTTITGNVLFVMVIISAYQPVKKFFDKATNGLFYRDVYDAQDLLNELNRVHVTSLDLEVLAKESMMIVLKHMKVEYASLCTINPKGDLRAFSSGRFTITQDELKPILRYMSRSQLSSVIADDLGQEVQGLSQKLQKANIAVVISLDDISSSKDGTGYLVIGPRNSGVAFTDADIKTLKTVVNELTLAIQNAMHYEEIQNFNRTLEQQVEVATKKLKAANARLVKLDETKDEFVGMASHQLRTPLTSVKGYLSMVLEGDAGPLTPQQEDLLKQSYMSSQRMVNLIADLLNLSRLNTGKFVIDSTPTDLRMIVDQEVAQLRETAKAKQIDLQWDMPPTFSLVPLDENKLHQVVMNMIDNALYYTPEKGVVEVVLRETPRAVEFRVKDSGIGVPRELQRHLFTKFYRADNARRMRPDGTGLGLYMAKKVVVAQGGSIIFESHEGKGSTFGFRFRKEPTPIASVEVA